MVIHKEPEASTRNQVSDGPKPGALWLLDEGRFSSQLRQALAATAHGHRHALLVIEIPRRPQICETCGEAADEALGEHVHKRLLAHLDSQTPVLAKSATDSLALCSNRDCQAATRLARAIHDDIERRSFRWHGHPFRLAANVGVLELGPQPSDAESWLSRAAELCRCTRELGGTGVNLLRYRHAALDEVSQELDWHQHLTRVI